MELECFKYKEKMDAENAVCQHPGDYCKYRTSCMIHFLSNENKNKGKTVNNADETPGVKKKETTK